MRLPDELARAIEAVVAGTPGPTLARASAELTAAYRASDGPRSPVATAAHRLAYAAVRMPATYAAVRRALAAAAVRPASWTVRSVLDLGAGPGTASWAAGATFPEIERFTLVECDRDLATLGRRLTSASTHPALANATWAHADVARAPAFEPHDLVVAAYLLGELDDRAARRVVEAGLTAADALLVLVEPGTPRGFEAIRAARSRAIELGAHVVAPCPHDAVCPMAGGDWCHFAARVERTSLHRRLKAGAMGHEDEKFSYVAVSKSVTAPAPARILRHPTRREGHTYLDLCARDGRRRVVVSKHDRDAYRRVRKAGWGDEWDE